MEACMSTHTAVEALLVRVQIGGGLAMNWTASIKTSLPGLRMNLG